MRKVLCALISFVFLFGNAFAEISLFQFEPLLTGSWDKAFGTGKEILVFPSSNNIVTQSANSTVYLTYVIAGNAYTSEITLDTKKNATMVLLDHEHTTQAIYQKIDILVPLGNWIVNVSEKQQYKMTFMDDGTLIIRYDDQSKWELQDNEIIIRSNGHSYHCAYDGRSIDLEPLGAPAGTYAYREK